MNKKQNTKSLKIIALVQVFSMILEIFAFSFILGGMIVINTPHVSAAWIDYSYKWTKGTTSLDSGAYGWKWIYKGPIVAVTAVAETAVDAVVGIPDVAITKVVPKAYTVSKTAVASTYNAADKYVARGYLPGGTDKTLNEDQQAAMNTIFPTTGTTAIAKTQQYTGVFKASDGTLVNIKSWDKTGIPVIEARDQGFLGYLGADNRVTNADTAKQYVNEYIKIKTDTGLTTTATAPVIDVSVNSGSRYVTLAGSEPSRYRIDAATTLTEGKTQLDYKVIDTSGINTEVYKGDPIYKQVIDQGVTDTSSEVINRANQIRSPFNPYQEDARIRAQALQSTGAVSSKTANELAAYTPKETIQEQLTVAETELARANDAGGIFGKTDEQKQAVVLAQEKLAILNQQKAAYEQAQRELVEQTKTQAAVGTKATLENINTQLTQTQTALGGLSGLNNIKVGESLTPAQIKALNDAGITVPTDSKMNADLAVKLTAKQSELSGKIEGLNKEQVTAKTANDKAASEAVDAKKAAEQGRQSIMPTEGKTNNAAGITTASQVFGNKGLDGISQARLDTLIGASPDALKELGISKIEKDANGVYTITNTGDTVNAKFEYKDGNLVMIDGTKKTADTYKTPLGEFSTYHPLLGNALEGISWGVVVLGISQLLAGFMSSDDKKSMVNSAGLAISAGLVAGKAVYGLIGEFGAEKGKLADWGFNKGGAGAKWAGGITGAIIAYYIFASQYTKTETTEQTIEFKCMTWQAPRGGSSCDLCNHDALRPCSEYRCKSLGQTCKLLNAGTGEEKCIDSAPDDVTSPGIKPMESALTNGYSYTDVKNRPPGGNGPAGMKITYNGGCLPSFTPFKWGIITTDKGNNGVELQPAQCKIDFNHTASFDDMNYYMDENNLYVENHTQAMSLPGATLNKKENTSLEIKSNAEYTMYVRCMDGNSNENRDEFAVRFCIDPTPDLTAPIIKSTSIDSGSAVLYKVDNVSLSVYTNEPANCKWSRKDSSYSNMENNMSCSNSLWQMNAEMFYTCKTSLTSIKDKEQNDFYFRCQDMNNNTQQQSYAFTLYGTQPLNILSAGPTGTIGSSTSTANVTLTVKTDNGFSNGASDCYYSTTNANSSFIKMVNTGGNTHSQSLDLVGGSYKYYYKCIDAGGNLDSNKTSFEVFVDKYAPAIVRAFQVSSKLYLVTDESSTCKYSTASCNFNMDSEGIDMPYANSVEHYSDLKVDQTYYIKCSDDFGNQPDPTECSMIIRPYQLAKE